jgi:alpha-tubulin suppressor-like RCC1 family protein
VSLGETLQLNATARDASGNTVLGKTFTWESSDDGIAMVGSSGLVTAVANGSVTITATSDGVTGTAAVDVSQVAVQLGFTVAPVTPEAGASITPAVEVAIHDALGNLVADATDGVTVAIGTNPSGGTLLGTTTVNAIGGIATFSELRIDLPGSGYTLEAMSGSLTTATSSTFDVTITNPFTSVSAAFTHSCSVTTIGNAYCWGWNEFGQLGDGTTYTRLTPVLVSGGLSFASVSAGIANSNTAVGGGFSCGVTTNGTAYCWGSNPSGQLGDGSNSDRNVPVSVAGGLSFASVSAAGDDNNGGSSHACGVTTSGDAYCWGSNAFGQLGDGTNTERNIPVLVSGGLTFGSVSAGAQYTCGVTTSGDGYCWGRGGNGQVGDGAGSTSSVPLLVTGGLTFTSVNAGSVHTCGVTTSGDAYCWGFNSNGQLGDGTLTERNTPVLVSGGLRFGSVSAGVRGGFTFGVTTSGDAYCWGLNSNGQLGDGTLTERNTPGLVSGGLRFGSVSAGGFHTCGVTTSGDAYCWGYNGFGQLGDGTSADATTPVRVSRQP